jgi:hypothetical protein
MAIPIDKSNNKASHAAGKAFWMLALLLSIGGVREAGAAFITVGARIPLTATTFVLPIEISEAFEVGEWTFDLTYDPDDVLINTSCDAFSGDPYCSFTTGAITEGDFFASGVPFNLLVPGFIELDPVTLAQTGSLFGVHGAFGGFPPAPSGSGTLAFIQFLQIGEGDSPIDVGGEGVTPVPEPATLGLMTTALAAGWLIRRRRDGRSIR